jgi:GTP-binding protein
VANDPFTTLYPNLGVVSVESHRSFVIADIPGLIEGAAEGAGLGIQFLKHVSRTLLLLHLVDVAPYDGTDPVEAVRVIEQELAKFSEELAQRERWLVLNKLDLLPEEEQEKVCADIIERLGWNGPVYRIAALSKEGTARLTQDIMVHLERQREEQEAGDAAEGAERNNS